MSLLRAQAVTNSRRSRAICSIEPRRYLELQTSSWLREGKRTVITRQSSSASQEWSTPGPNATKSPGVTRTISRIPSGNFSRTTKQPLTRIEIVVAFGHRPNLGRRSPFACWAHFISTACWRTKPKEGGTNCPTNQPSFPSFTALPILTRSIRLITPTNSALNSRQNRWPWR